MPNYQPNTNLRGHKASQHTAAETQTTPNKPKNTTTKTNHSQILNEQQKGEHNKELNKNSIRRCTMEVCNMDLSTN